MTSFTHLGNPRNSPQNKRCVSFQLVGRKLLYIFQENFLPKCILFILTPTVADLHTKVPGTCPPNRTKFFCFYICFHQKAPVSEVGAPSNEGWRPPQQEILDLPLPYLMLYTSGPVSLKERLLYTLNKLFVKQVKSFLLLLDLDPFIPLSSSHNIKYIKFTSP